MQGGPSLVVQRRPNQQAGVGNQEPGGGRSLESGKEREPAGLKWPRQVEEQLEGGMKAPT